MSRFATSQRGFLLTLTADWFSDQQIKADPTGILVDARSREVPLDVALRRFKLDTGTLTDARRGLSRESFDLAFDEYVSQMQQRARYDISDSIAFDPGASSALLPNFLQALKGEVVQEDVAILWHFIWQVKRKLLGKQVVYHLMPIVTGPQGTGKSTLIYQFLAPIMSVTLRGRPVDSVTDERNFKTLNTRFVVFFDEMAKATRTDVDRLKEIISADVVNYRPLYTNNNMDAKQNCTFIGAANKDVRDLIYDTTGMRRFYQIMVPNAPASILKPRWELANNINYQELWKSVDETQDMPTMLMPHMDAISAHQQELRTTTSIEDFLEEREFVPGETAVLLSKLYTDYINFCRESGRREPMGRRSFLREIVQRGFVKTRKEAGIMVLVSKSVGNIVKELQ